MNPADTDTLDIDALMRHIRREIAQRNARAPASGGMTPPISNYDVGDRPAFVEEPARQTRIGESAPALAPKREYTVEEFLNYHDEDFLRNAYRALLRREPNDE